MKKILFVTNALELKPSALSFAIDIARLEQSKLVGLFLEQHEYSLHTKVKQIAGLPYIDEEVSEVPFTKKNRKKEGANMEYFKAACREKSVAYQVTTDKGPVLQDAIKESRYADMIIVDAATSFAGYSGHVPTKFVRNLLTDAQCPVLIAPHNYTEIGEIIFAYDGSDSSVFAMKQFVYLLPGLPHKKVILLQINDDKQPDAGNNKLIKSWLTSHYQYVTLQTLHGDLEEELVSYCIGRNNALLVIGAYGRNIVSSFFKHSVAEMVVEAVDIPVFITHH